MEDFLGCGSEDCHIERPDGGSQPGVVQSSSSLACSAEFRFVGRSQLLQSIQDLLLGENATATSVIIQGADASGKTRLLHKLSQRGRLCLWIAFTDDDDKPLDPFPAFWKGLNLFLPGFLKDRHQFALYQEASQLLRSFIPCLGDLCARRDEDLLVTTSMATLCHVEGALMALFRWILTLAESDEQQLGDEVARRYFPFLLAVDDLHLASDHARNFLLRLQSRFKDTQLFVIATCHLVHDYSDSLASWLVCQKQAGTHIKRLPNWSCNNVAHVVRIDPGWKGAALRHDIAQVVYNRTGGHVGSVLALLRVASEMNYKTAKDISSIPLPRPEESNVVTGIPTQSGFTQWNEAPILTHLLKIQYFAMPESVQVMLQVAALYQPYFFGVDSVAYLVQQPLVIVQQQLLYAYKRGMLRLLRGSIYALSTTAKKIVLLAAIESGKLHALHWRIGRRLQGFYFSRSKESQENSEASLTLQRAVNHLNIGSVERRHSTRDDSEDGPSALLARSLAELNTRVAVFCLAQQEYFAAAYYLRSAIDFLGASSWQRHFTWRLELESKLAQAEYGCGNLDRAYAGCGDVINHARSFADKKSAVSMRVSILLDREKSDDAVELIMKELNDLGERLPSTFLAVQLRKQVKDIQKRLIRFDWGTWALISPRRNQALLDRMNLLERLVQSTMLSGSTQHSMGILRSLQLVLDTGPAFSLSALCFIYWGSLCREMGNVENATRFGKYGLELMNERRHTMFDAYAYALYSSGIGIWVHVDNRSPTNDLHRSHRSLDDIGSSSICSIAIRIESFWGLFLFKSKLADLETDFNVLILSLQDHGRDNLIPIVAPFANLVYSLTRPWKSSPANIKGKKNLDSLCGRDAVVKSALLCRMITALLYDDMPAAESFFNPLVELLDGSSDKERCHSPPVSFFVGMVAILLARRNKAESKRYRSRAESMIRKLDGYVKQGCSNCHHYSVLLRAQYLAYKPNVIELSKVLNAFDSAIVAAQHRNAVLIRAFACERAVHFLFSRQAKSTAASYLKRSVRLYRQCDAHGKVKHMTERFNGVVGPDSND